METVFLNPRFASETAKDTDLVVFLHTQRTAGSALRHILAGIYGEEEVFCTQYAPDYVHWDQVTTDRLESCKVFAGHSNFMERVIPNRRLWYLTIVRHPVFRAVSLYFYCRKYDTHALHELAMKHDLNTFYRLASEDRTTYFSNTMCRRICGRPKASTAIRNIDERYLAVGCTEFFGDFVAALGRHFGWPEQDVPRMEQDIDRYGNLLNEEFVELVARKNREDWKLFEEMAFNRMKLDPANYIARPNVTA